MEEYSNLELRLMEMPFASLTHFEDGWSCDYSVDDVINNAEAEETFSSPAEAVEAAYERWKADGRQSVAEQTI